MASVARTAVRTGRVTTSIAVALALLSHAAVALADPSPPPAIDAPMTPGGLRTFTEDELVAYALAQNPTLKAAQRERAVAKAGERVATTIENPVLRLEWLHAGGDPRVNRNTNAVQDRAGFGLGLGWNPPRPGEYPARREAAEAHTREVEAELIEQAWNLEASVRAGCATVEALSEEVLLADRATETRKAIQAVLKDRVAHGVSTQLDLGLANLSVARAEQDHGALAIRRETTLLELAALAGIPTGTRIELTPLAHPDADPIPDLARLEAEALARRPLLTADSARSANREATLRAERARRWPWISLNAFPRYRMYADSAVPNDLYFGLDVTLPILNQNGGKIAAAEADRDLQTDLHAAHVALIVAEVRAARAEAVGWRDLLARTRLVIEPAIADYRALVKLAIDGRQLDYLALLTSGETVLRSERDLVNAKLAYRTARLRLIRASGAMTRPKPANP